MIVGLDEVHGVVALEQDRLGQASHAGSGVDGMTHGEGLTSTFGPDCRWRQVRLAVIAFAGQVAVEEGQTLRAIGGGTIVADHCLVVGLAAVSAVGPEGRVGRVPFRLVEVLRRLQLGVAAVEVALVVGALDRGRVYFSISGFDIGIGMTSCGLVSLVERRCSGCSGRRIGRAGVGAPLTLMALGLLHFGFAGLRRRRRRHWVASSLVGL